MLKKYIKNDNKTAKYRKGTITAGLIATGIGVASVSAYMYQQSYAQQISSAAKIAELSVADITSTVILSDSLIGDCIEIQTDSNDVSVSVIESEASTDTSGEINITSATESATDENSTEDVYAEDDADATNTAVSDNIIFVGDSRFVGMFMYVDSDATVIAEIGKGYKWLIDTADPELRAALTDDSIVIFNLGVNDLGNAAKYVDYINNLQAEFPNITIYYMSVNPVEQTTVSNESIDSFNEIISNGITATYLDTNTYLQENGFSTTDGLHYSKETYISIYDYVVDHT